MRLPCTEDAIRSVCPGFGLAPKFYDEVVGKNISVDIQKNTAVSLDKIAF